ncbi:MAG: PAS domain S-box protein, partial [Chloroflexi bacterium]|nr:PAS domain S-box protein [Chloroflexota bacterium]
LFVDDLHWADNASIQLLKQLIDLPQTGALFLIGAYRDDEIETSHPTAVMLAEAAANGYPLPQLTLGPLDSEAVHEWLTDALNKPPAEALVTAIYQKTAGNPFFIKTFMRTLLDQDLLFHHIEDGWQWRLTDIDQLQITENAAELKAQQINQFPDETRELLMTAACLGASFDLEIVAVVSEISQEQTYIHLRPALKAGLLLKRSRTYRFAHDRIHEATCSLMTSETLIARHLFIGRLLLARIPETAVTKQLFTIVNQLNAGIDLVTDRAEKIKFARLNMQAGQKALKATAYESAVIYLRYGHRLLPDDCWQTDYNLAFKLHRLLAEAEYLAANYARADALYPILFKRAQSTTDKLELYFVQIAQYHLQGKFPEALAIGKEGLILLGIDLSNSPTSPQQLFAEEVNQFEATLQTLNVADLLQASPMTAPQHIQLMQLLSFVSISAFFTDTAVQVWTAMKMVNMSLAHGHHETSAFAYAGYGHVVGIPLLHEVENSYRLGKIGFELAQKQNNLSLRGKTYFRFGYGIVHWREHISATVPILRDAYRYALEGGNLTYAGYALFHWLHNRIISGQNLAQLQVEAQEALPFLQRTNANFLEAAFRPGILQALASLLGQTDSLASFNNDDFDEAEYLAQRPHVPIFISAYYCAKIRNLYFLGCYEEGLTLLDKLDVVVTAGPQAALVPETTFFLALTLTAVYADADESAQAEYDGFLNNFQTQFRMWTENCPDNYEHKYLLLQAEQARLNRQIEAAIALYRQSIKAAQQVRFFHMEALGNELYGRFWLALGEDAAAEIYLSRAYNLYRDWGSVAKIRQIETGYPDTISAAQNVNILSPSASILSRLDLLTVVKSAQAISGEINLDKLLSKMMAIIVENAGAQKGVLITEVDGRLLVQAEWIESETPTKISQKTLLEKSAALAPAIVNYVKRTGETVIISDAHQDPQFAHDPYVTRNRPKSILCMPLLNQGRLVAILYLENNLTAGTFTPERLDILSILSSQAAVSIENATLYVNLQVSARKYRNLFEGSQDAIFITTLAGRFIDMNPAGLIIIGFAWEELRQRHVVQMYANPADRAKFLETIQKNNDVEDFETDLRRKDGAIIHVLITATTQVTEDGEIYFQGIIRDITEQKRAEAQLHTYMEELERSNQELQQFAYIASHDLQEPLRKVRTFGDRLETRYGDVLDQHGQDYLNRMQNAATRMQTLIEDLLTFSRVTTRIRPFALADLNWVVREVLRDLEVRIEELQAQVIVRDLPVIEADQVQMRLLFQNLISNALKFHRAEVSPLVRIEASLFSEEYESWCQITVVDNGIGFEEKYLDRIFTVFQRLHGRTKYAGTGIGLAICRRIVERHKGQITAVSQPGKGASFIITLPVRQS